MAFLYIIWALLFAAPSQATSTDIAVFGSSSMLRTVLSNSPSFQAQGTTYGLHIHQGGSLHGLKQLVIGNADIALITEPLENLLPHISKEQAAAIQMHYLGDVRISFITHKDNPVQHMSLERLKSALTGNIEKWDTLDACPIRIQIVTELEGDGIRPLIEQTLLKGAAIRGNIRAFPLVEDALSYTASTPAALGIITAPMLNDSVSEITTDEEVWIPVYAITASKPSKKTEHFLAYVKATIHAMR